MIDRHQLPGDGPGVTIVEADRPDEPVLRRLIELYLYDLSRLDGRPIGPHGEYGYRYLDQYWTEEQRYPYLIQVDGHWAGFALVNRHTALGEDAWSMAEFFVMAAYRRRGIGERVARWLFDRHAGTWHVAELRHNVEAQAFWRRAIGSYTNGQFREVELHDERWDGPIQIFVSPVSQHGTP
ncbi:MAG: GNAT family N-acetyltransferase [Chloroflexota bacterium]